MYKGKAERHLRNWIKGNFVLSKGFDGVLLIFCEERWAEFSRALFAKISLGSKEGRILIRFSKEALLRLG